MDPHFAELQHQLKRFIKRFLQRPEDVEDIAQESFVRVLEAGSQGKIEYPKAYLYRTARNLAFNKLSSSAHQLVDAIEDLPEPDVLASATTTEDEVGAQRRFELFCRAAAQLPEQCRTVLILRKVYGLSQREVAEQLGIAISTVEKHLAKGLLRCADYMDKHERTDSAAPAGEVTPMQRFRHQP